MTCAPIEVIDAQIHVWADESAGRPWLPEFARTREAFLRHGIAITADRAVAAMDAVGVAAALVTSFGIYDDIDYAVCAVRAFPERLGLVTQLDMKVAEPLRQAKAYAEQADVLAFRLSFLTTNAATGYEDSAGYERVAHRELDPLFAFAAGEGRPVMLVATGRWSLIDETAARHPDTCFVLDHLGMVQGPDRVPAAPRFASLDNVLRLARRPNMHIKLSGAPALSGEAYPYRDVWEPVRRIVEAFGPRRVFWGSDFGRTRPLHSYADAVGYLLHNDVLDAADLPLVMGESLRQCIGWPARPCPRGGA
jgi:L-fuconolactonase